MLICITIYCMCCKLNSYWRSIKVINLKMYSLGHLEKSWYWSCSSRPLLFFFYYLLIWTLKSTSCHSTVVPCTLLETWWRGSSFLGLCEHLLIVPYICHSLGFFWPWVLKTWGENAAGHLDTDLRWTGSYLERPKLRQEEWIYRQSVKEKVWRHVVPSIQVNIKRVIVPCWYASMTICFFSLNKTWASC